MRDSAMHIENHDPDEDEGSDFPKVLRRPATSVVLYIRQQKGTSLPEYLLCPKYSLICGSLGK